MWNLKSWTWEYGVELKESEIPLTIGSKSRSSTDKHWNPAPGIRNPICGIQNPRLLWILLDGAACFNLI